MKKAEITNDPRWMIPALYARIDLIRAAAGLPPRKKVKATASK